MRSMFRFELERVSETKDRVRSADYMLPGRALLSEAWAGGGDAVSRRHEIVIVC